MNPSKTIIAGPCSAETERQVMNTARSLATAGISIFRAGIWKPRTKPGQFEGIGTPGLEWLRNVREETGMRVTTEVANSRHVEAALKAEIDILWIGARTTANPFAVQEIADSLRGCGIPVMVKNPINPDIELWTGAIERLQNAGIRIFAAIHRGFSTYGEQTYRYAPQWQIPIELRRRMPSLPILCDPSHMGGKREHVLPLAQASYQMNADGLFVEVHCNPDEALSDSRQQLTPDMFIQLLEQLRQHKVPDSAETGNLAGFRNRIDGCDRQIVEILAKRMDIVKEISAYKNEHDLTVLQSERYNDIINNLIQEGRKFGLSENFVKNLFGMIHTESVNLQLSAIQNHKL